MPQGDDIILGGVGWQWVLQPNYHWGCKPVLCRSRVVLGQLPTNRVMCPPKTSTPTKNHLLTTETWYKLLTSLNLKISARERSPLTFVDTEFYLYTPKGESASPSIPYATSLSTFHPALRVPWLHATLLQPIRRRFLDRVSMNSHCSSVLFPSHYSSDHTPNPRIQLVEFFFLNSVLPISKAWRRCMLLTICLSEC